VFTLDLIPGFVFKIMDNPESLLSRYRNHIYSLQVLKAHKFDLIVIPNVGIIKEYNLLSKTDSIYAGNNVSIKEVVKKKVTVEEAEERKKECK